MPAILMTRLHPTHQGAERGGTSLLPARFNFLGRMVEEPCDQCVVRRRTCDLRRRGPSRSWTRQRSRAFERRLTCGCRPCLSKAWSMLAMALDFAHHRNTMEGEAQGRVSCTISPQL